MVPLDNSDSRSGTDLLTIAVTSILAAAAIVGSLFCLIYAVWWLVAFWAPA